MNRSCLVIGHRGASWDAPENTLAAVDLAFAQGADGVEVDVHLTADERIVAIHDGNTQRLSDLDFTVGEVSYEDLASLDVGSWKDEKFRGERIPLLEDVAGRVPEGMHLFVEIKCGVEIVEPLCSLYAAGVFAHCRLTVISYNINVLQMLGNRHPEMETYIVADINRPGGPGLAALMDRAVEAACEGLDLSLSRMIDEDMAAKIRQRGLSLHVWTVDDPDTAVRLFTIGVASITTNRPRLILDALERTVGS